MKRPWRTLASILLTIVLMDLFELLPGFEFGSKTEMGMYWLLMWLVMNEILKERDN